MVRADFAGHRSLNAAEPLRRDLGMTTHRLLGAAAAFLLAAALGGCMKTEPAKPTADAGKIADAVKADMNQLVTDFNAHDAVKAVSHDGPDVVNMFHGQPNAVGPTADLTNTKQLFAASPDAKITVGDIAVDVPASGDMAVLHATYTYSFTDPKTKQPVTESGNWLAGYKPQPDGSWKLAWTLAADAPTAAPAPGKT
jgi:ketosteroid isomerase-like protein